MGRPNMVPHTSNLLWNANQTWLNRGLAVVALGLFAGVLRGLTSLEDFANGGLVGRVAAVITAAVLAKGFHVFWLHLAHVLLKAKTGRVKLGALIATIPPLLLITGASAHLVATGLVGSSPT